MEESWDVRLPRLFHTSGPATANMTSRAGASVFPPATSLCPEPQLSSSSSSLSHALVLPYCSSSEHVETATVKVKVVSCQFTVQWLFKAFVVVFLCFISNELLFVIPHHRLLTSARAARQRTDVSFSDYFN